MARRAHGSRPSSAKLDDALGAFACDVVGAFLHTADGMKAYRASRTPSRLRQAAKRRGPETLNTWEMQDGGVINLVAAPAPNQFVVMAEHPDFRALIAVEYDIDTDDPAPTEILAFQGDERKALKTLRQWGDALEVEADWDDPVETAMEDLFDAVLSGETPSFRLPLPDNAVARVQTIATRAAAKLRRSERSALTETDATWLQKYPDSLLLALDGYVAACSAQEHDELLIDAYQQMLLMILESLRFEVEQAIDWATGLVKAYEARIVALADGAAIPAENWYFLPMSFDRAGIPMSELTTASFAAAGAKIAPALDTAEIASSMRELVDQLAREVSSSFELNATLQEMRTAMPTEGWVFLVHELALCAQPTARDAVPLMLLDEDATVRQAAAAALEQTAAPETLSPVSLRRIIAVRNWVPVADRPAVDRVIRKAREKGVTIAPWPPATSGRAEDIVVIASMIDGVGAQSVIVTQRAGRTGLFGLLLLKGGIRDATCLPAEKRRDIKSHIELVENDTQAVEVDRAFLDVAVQHAIATGLAGGVIPGAALLDIAERIGASDWKDRPIDVAADVARLFGGLDPAERDEAAIKASLRRSERWTQRDDVFETWYEGDAETRALIGKIPRRETMAAIGAVLEQVLEKQRGAWTGWLLLLALWARSAKDQTIHARWKDFLVLAHCLSSGWKLADIPMVRTAAATTVRMARNPLV